MSIDVFRKTKSCSRPILRAAVLLLDTLTQHYAGKHSSRMQRLPPGRKEQTAVAVGAVPRFFDLLFGDT